MNPNEIPLFVGEATTHDTMTSPMFDAQHPIWNAKQFDA